MAVCVVNSCKPGLQRHVVVLRPGLERAHCSLAGLQDLKDGKRPVEEFVEGLVRDGITLVIFMESMARIRDADQGLDANDLVKALFVRTKLMRNAT